MNEPVTVIQTALFTLDCNYRIVHVLRAFLQSIIHICENWSTFGVTFWLYAAVAMAILLHKKNYTTVYFPWILHSSICKFSKVVSKCFLQVFKDLKYYVFQKLYFWWMSSFLAYWATLSDNVDKTWTERFDLETCAELWNPHFNSEFTTSQDAWPKKRQKSSS